MIKNKFSESDFEKLGLKNCSKSSMDSFLEVFNRQTLGKNVSTAFDLKKQGHFKRAMLLITEVNRDQVTAIREVQNVLNKLENRGHAEIVFKNYRQTPPLQIGLSNGKDILELLDGIGNHFECAQNKAANELHQVEEELDFKREELSFFQERMKGDISAEEMDDLKEKVAELMRRVYLAKKQIIDTLIKFVNWKYKALVGEDKISLISNLYLIITSSIETKDSSFVKV